MTFAANQHGTSPAATKLRVVTDRAGRPLRVFLGPQEITHLVARVQTLRTAAGEAHEVVLAVPAAQENQR